MDLATSIRRWRVRGVFTQDRSRVFEVAEEMIASAGLAGAVYLHSRSSSRTVPAGWPTWCLEDMSTKRSNRYLAAMNAVTPRTLLVLDDVETIRNYPQSMTRNIINHLAPRTRFKLIAGGTLVVNGLDDLYAPFAVLDKQVLHANHYWCFAEEHREVSVFDGRTVIDNKDPAYLAAKLRPFVLFDLVPDAGNEVQTQLYAALHAAPRLDRVQDLTDLRMP
ncbi:MAG: hypothetical protein JW993_14505 [Sedimentisphaerales bacterium]|nr:hypothetical protein [Sedimentisphaerales bacterium]